MSFADSSFASAPFSSEVEDNAIVSLTGIQLTIAQNNVGLVTDNNILVTAAEDQMDFSIGTVIAEAESIVDTVTGVESSTDLGTIEVSASAPVSVTGEEAPAEIGTVTILAGATGSPSGEELSFSIGEETVTGTALVEPTGVESSADVGTAIGRAGAIVAVTGLSTQFADGTSTVTGDAIVQPTGLQIQFSEGTATAPAAVILTGVEMSAFVGNIRSTPWANVVTGASNTWTEVAA